MTATHQAIGKARLCHMEQMTSSSAHSDKLWPEFRAQSKMEFQQQQASTVNAGRCQKASGVTSTGTADVVRSVEWGTNSCLAS